jgi:transcriptional regulator with XRE-family HTH domain
MVVAPLTRKTRRWWLRSNRHLEPQCLADHFRAKRLRENLTMKELAQNLGLAHGTLKYWELHKSTPTGVNRKKAVQYLGFDPDARNARNTIQT